MIECSTEVSFFLNKMILCALVNGASKREANYKDVPKAILVSKSHVVEKPVARPFLHTEDGRWYIQSRWEEHAGWILCLRQITVKRMRTKPLIVSLQNMKGDILLAGEIEQDCEALLGRWPTSLGDPTQYFKTHKYWRVSIY